MNNWIIFVFFHFLSSDPNVVDVVYINQKMNFFTMLMICLHYAYSIIEQFYVFLCWKPRDTGEIILVRSWRDVIISKFRYQLNTLIADILLVAKKVEWGKRRNENIFTFSLSFPVFHRISTLVSCIFLSFWARGVGNLHINVCI